MKSEISGWPMATLGELIEIHDYRRVPLSTKQRNERQGDYPYYGASGIIDHIDGYLFDGRYLLVSEDGENLNSRKTPIVFFADGQFWVNNHAHIIRAKKEKADEYFLKCCIENLDITPYVTGAAQPKLSQANLKSMKLFLPPLPTQRKIAAVLSAYDDLIENNVRRIAILEEMAAALYREWFIELRFPGHESVPIAESEQGRVPQGWKIKTLGDLATDERRAANPTQVDADTPYIGLEHIPRKSIALSEWGRAADVSSAKLFFNQGEILFGKIRPYFHKVAVAPVNGVCSTDAIVIVPRAAELFALVLCCASSEEFVAHAVQTSQGTKMPRANWGVMSRFPVVVPPVPLMQRFNAAVNEMVEQIQKLTAVNANLRATRDLLLPKLVAGEVDVSQLAIAGATDETDETTKGADDADL